MFLLSPSDLAITPGDSDYDAGLFVPAYYGCRFTVATKRPQFKSVVSANYIGGRYWPASTYMTQMDTTFICDTLAEAQAECDNRNHKVKGHK